MSKHVKKFYNQPIASEKLREAIGLVADSFEQTGCPQYIQDAYENIEYNECGLALENLCENLYEFSCPISQKAYNLLEEAGSVMKIDNSCWEVLKLQIIR